MTLSSTTGGSGGTTTTVTTLDALTSAVTGDSKKIVIISGKFLHKHPDKYSSQVI